MIQMMLLLFAGHALCDYPLQGDFLARGKNPLKAILGIPWQQCLFAHALIHAGMVLVITKSLWLACAELMIHAITDYAKCVGWFGDQTYGTEGINPKAFNIDQAIHYGCKILWAVIVAI